MHLYKTPIEGLQIKEWELFDVAEWFKSGQKFQWAYMQLEGAYK